MYVNLKGTKMNNNLLPGDYITVVKWLRDNDMSYVGEIFKILAIEDNLYQVEAQESSKYLLLLDSNKVLLKRVSANFAEKVINNDRSVQF